MLPKFKVVGDRGANQFYSSSIIINNLNKGAKEVGLYDENGKIVVYDTTANQHGYNADAILCVYETSLPTPILRNAGGKPIIGCSLHNLFFITDIYPSDLAAVCHLGVDSELFKPLPRVIKDKFRFLHLAESNARSGLDVVLKVFCEAFPSSSNVELYIKDRGATETFKQYVKSVSYGSNVIHDIENTESFEGVQKLYSESDVMVFVSRSTTWGMSILESLSMGLPVITTNYAGPREYVVENFNGWTVKHNVVNINQEKLNKLVKMGFRNHMFPIENHLFPPYWAEPDPTHLKEIMLRAVDAPEYPYLSKNARIAAENFTWAKAATSLSLALKKVLK